MGEQQQPKHNKEISTSIVQEKCAESSLKVFNTTDGLSKFQIMAFKPNSTTFVSADRICLCQQCKDEYAFGCLFQEF